MPRNDFISDNLVHMRDRLKENTARLNGEIVAETPPEKAKLSDRIVKSGPSEPERLRNDVKGRIERDFATVNAELELAALRRSELEKFREILEKLTAEADAAEVDKLRLAYFQAAGRASAFLKGPLHSTAAAGPDGGNKQKSFGQIFKEALPLGSAIIAAALIVAGTLAVLLG